MKLTLAALCIILLLGITPALAAIPATISYQGFLTDNSGVAINSTVSMTLSLYDAASGGNQLWSETQPTVVVTKGIYTVQLGSVNTLNLPFDATYYLGVTVGSDAEMTPRLVLTSAPTVFRAMNAETLLSDSNSSIKGGNGALAANTTGTQNTAIGSSALNHNTTGGRNTAIGLWAMYSQSYSPGYGYSTENVAIGIDSLFNNNPNSTSTGKNNTAVGNRSLYGNQTGANNIGIGFQAGQSLTTGNYNIEIGNSGVAGEGNTIRIGDSNQTRTFISGIRGVGSLTGTQTVVIDANGQLGSVTSSSGTVTSVTASAPLSVANGTSTPAITLGTVPIANGGTGSTTQNFVDLTTGQTIAGTKTFSSTISGNISGTAANVTGTVAVANGGTGTASGSITGTGALTFTAGGTNTNINLAPNGTGTVDVASKRITSLATPTNATDAATKAYVDTTVGTATSRTPMQIATLKWYEANQSLPTYSVGSQPHGIAFDGTNIWVANYNSNSVTKLNASDGSTVGTYTVGSYPECVAFDGTNIWVANSNSNTVTKLKASDGSTVGTYAAGTSPLGVTFDGTYIWVTNFNTGKITKLKASDGTQAAGSPYTAGGSALISFTAYDGANVWVVYRSSSSVTKMRGSDGSVLGTYSVGASHEGIAFDGTNIWVSNSTSNTVTKLKASDGSLVGTYTTGNNPQGVAFDGTNIWVSNYNDNTITKLKASDGSLVGTYTTGTNPKEIAFDGMNIWVGNNGSSSVSKL